MNIDTVETSGVDASSPDFAEVVNDTKNWEPYAQKTYKACFADADGYILSKVVGSNPAAQGYYEDVTTLPSEGAGTPENYYLVKMVRDNAGYFSSYSVKGTVPAGTTTAQLLDANGAYALNGSIYSYVTGGNRDGSRNDYAGWYGTALLNNNEYEADNIEASFRLVKGGNLNEGFAFMVTKSDVTDIVHHNGQDIVVPRLSGYFMSVCTHNTRTIRTLWRFDDYALDMDSSANAGTSIWCAPGHAGHEELWYAGNQLSYIPAPRSNAATTSTVTQKPTTVTALGTWIDDSQNIDYNVKADKEKIVIKRTDHGNESDSNPAWGVNKPTTYGLSSSLQTTASADGHTIYFPNPRDVEETVADIKITANANGTTTYKDSVTGKGSTVNRPNFEKGTYGFWGQNCEQGNQALITNLNVAITKTKSFGDIVYEPEWTDGALGLTSGLAEDAAEILERDYDIDAGEVLSMNIDTVETQTSSSEVKASDADTILGNADKGIPATWGSYTFAYESTYGGGGEAFNQLVVPPTTSSNISDAWEIRNTEVKSLVENADGSTSVETGEESKVLFNKGNWSYEFLRNDAQWQKSSEITEATYKTTMGGDTTLQGTENLAACGEAWWFFKLSEDNKEGYAICYDNHGHDGCGLFTRFWFQMYIVHYDWNNPIKNEDYKIDTNGDNNNNESLMVRGNGNRNVTILKKWRVSPLQVCPRYNITVQEKGGKATITVDPDELNSPYSYIGGEEWNRYNQYYLGYNKETGALNTDDVNNSYRNKDNYDWAWPGSTQDALSCTIDLSDSIQNVNTTQAFSAFAWNGTYFANNSVDVTKQITKSFGDIVYEPQWTDGAPGSPRGWRRTRRRSWRGTTT